MSFGFDLKAYRSQPEYQVCLTDNNLTFYAPQLESHSRDRVTADQRYCMQKNPKAKAVATRLTRQQRYIQVTSRIHTQAPALSKLTELIYHRRSSPLTRERSLDLQQSFLSPGTAPPVWRQDSLLATMNGEPGIAVRKRWNGTRKLNN